MTCSWPVTPVALIAPNNKHVAFFACLGPGCNEWRHTPRTLTKPAFVAKHPKCADVTDAHPRHP